ncbi:unnamed protein product [Kluyveromyces dobzhanskii CBS 2104]|uniref:WGS project CCBQ000000000 data, contig 00008 n=1 Tax=Kluyveromyces dobzhanskii CBS 2104 TaxID=1427455 RepID=A0A0A8L9U4_9SACH|nr:unnamed protein product [Kluyveromyces dobzhanskii CBS 2104]
MGSNEFTYGLRSFRQPSEASSFEDITLINNLRQDLLKGKSGKKGNPVSWNVSKENKRRKKPGKRSVPLSAYTCHSEKPLISNNEGEICDSSTTNVLDKSTLLLIRSLGYSSLRPIGIDKTLKEIEKDRSGIQEKQRVVHRETEGNDTQELRRNANQTSSSFIVSNEDHRRREQFVVLTEQVGEQSEEEYDQSYDYDNEYAEIHGQDSIEERTRGTFVENSQLIDASRIDRSEQSNSDQQPFVNENEDSVNEQPSLTISETVEANAQGSRVSSLI